VAGSRFLPAELMPVEHVMNDWRTRLALHATAESRVVVIDIDERSLAEAGQGPWPWPRPVIARLLQTLIDEYHVASIAVDMVLPEVRPDEAALAQQMRRAEVTGAVVYDLDHRNLPPLLQRLPAPPPFVAAAGAPLVSGPAALSNHAGLMPIQAGHINPMFDDDGALRRLPPLICNANRECRPSLTMMSFMSLLDGPRLSLQRGEGWLAAPWTLTISAAESTVMSTLPLSRDGLLVVPYRHSKKDWTYISAVDILNKKPDPALLKGVMVLLGGTALGMQDVIATPISPVTVGFEPHVEILSALLDNDFPIEPRWGLAMDMLLLLPFGVFLGWALGRFGKPGQRAALFPAWLVLTWLASATLVMLALRQFNLLLPLIPILVFPPLAVLLTVLAELYRTGSEHAGVLSLLSAYLPRPVAARLATFGRGSMRVDTSLDASRREISVMFADVHGFAGITEERPPEVIARLMQRVFSEMAEAVVQNNGTIDKFIGDAIMAFWNAPDDDPKHARHALAAAAEIHRRIAALAPFCAELGVLPISVGIGIESGHALVGNFGSIHRRTFTALGEPVVLASRLEGLTARYNEAILLGPGCAAELDRSFGAAATRPLGELQIRGRVQALKVYAPN
jgi:adenylate cyclase